MYKIIIAGIDAIANFTKKTTIDQNRILMSITTTLLFPCVSIFSPIEKSCYYGPTYVYMVFG